jgi:hypothetical protein
MNSAIDCDYMNADVPPESCSVRIGRPLIRRHIWSQQKLNGKRNVPHQLDTRLFALLSRNALSLLLSRHFVD